MAPTTSRPRASVIWLVCKRESGRQAPKGFPGKSDSSEESIRPAEMFFHHIKWRLSDERLAKPIGLRDTVQQPRLRHSELPLLSSKLWKADHPKIAVALFAERWKSLAESLVCEKKRAPVCSRVLTAPRDISPIPSQRRKQARWLRRGNEVAIPLEADREAIDTPYEISKALDVWVRSLHAKHEGEVLLDQSRSPSSNQANDRERQHVRNLFELEPRRGDDSFPARALSGQEL